MRKTFILPIIILFQTFPSIAQRNQVPEFIIEKAKTDNQTMHHLDVLTNRIGGRLVGSSSYETATYWVANLLKTWGLEVEVQEVGELPVGFDRGPWFGKMLDNDGMDLHFVTPSYTSGTKGVQRGHVVAEPKTQTQFNNMKGKLNGAWVLITGTNDGWPIDYSERGDSLRRVIIAKNEITQSYNDSITRINRANPNNTPLPLKALEDAPALFYKEMRDAGILGIIQSSAVPIRALYDRRNVERNGFLYESA